MLVMSSAPPGAVASPDLLLPYDMAGKLAVAVTVVFDVANREGEGAPLLPPAMPATAAAAASAAGEPGDATMLRGLRSTRKSWGRSISGGFSTGLAYACVRSAVAART
jgi:hypothetical protein